MANTYTSPHISSAILPDPSGTSSGMDLKSETVARIGNLSNYLIGHAGASQPVISQSWCETVASWNGASISLCTWRYPILSTGHTILTIQMKAKASASNGTATFVSTLNAATVTINVNNAASTWYETTLNIGAVGAASVDTLTLNVAAAAGDICIESITVCYSALTSPLPTGVMTTGGRTSTPMGTTSLAVDRPLTGSRGAELIETAESISRRPRVLANWSGLSGNQAYRAQSGAHWLWDQTVGQRNRGQSWAEARAQNITYYVHAYIEETIGFDRVVQWADGQISNIAAGQTGWISLSWSATDIDDPQGYWSYPLIIDSVPCAPKMGIEVAGAATLITAPVKSFVYWEVRT